MSLLQSMVSVITGQTASTTLSLIGDPRFCQLPEKVLFPTASSFIDTTTPGNVDAYRAVVDRISFAPPGELLLVVGHTDDVGDPSDNDPLSGRRADGALAVLEGRVDVWETNFKEERASAWTDDNFRTMLSEVTGATPTTTEINRHKEITPAGEARRVTLFTGYFEKLLGIPGGSISLSTLVPATLGCGENHVLATGEHAPSRRAEFFFFRGTSSPIVLCSEYPSWITPCGTLPRTPPAVSIDPIDTIRQGRSEPVQVNVNPSPLPLGASVTLELTTTSGTGAAEFVGTGSNTIEITASGPVRVRGVTVSDEIDNIRITARFTGEAAILDEEDLTVVDAVSIFLQFEVFNLTTDTFEKLGAGVSVDLMDEAPIPDTVLATRQTDAGGRVFFNVPAPSTPADIFFLVHLGMDFAGHALPATWSTNGWEATDGTPGLRPGFTGGSLGTPSAPIVFRIGLDFHGELKYHVDSGRRSGNDDPAPKGVLVKLMQEEIGTDRELLDNLRTKADGTFDGVSFDAEPGRTFYLRVVFEIEDDSIHLQRARFSEVPFVPPLVDVITPAGATMEWDSIDSDADKHDFPSHRSTSIGTVASPAPFLCTLDDRNVALHILKVLREEAVFFFEMTKGDWGGVRVAVTPTAPVTAFSWPVTRIQLKFPDDRWDRETVTHEMGHQVMWNEVGISSLGILYEASVFGDLVLSHRVNLLANTKQALIEGWAEFVEAIFEGSGTPPFSVLAPIDTDGNTVPGGLGPPPRNRGESVEGALANGLWAIFENHVAVRPSPLGAQVPESINGDVTATAPWILDPNVQSRFLSMIWEPLKKLKPLANPDSTSLLAEIRTAAMARVPDDWHTLMPELQAFNMAMHRPTATKIEPHWGPVAGGASIGLLVKISGTDFVKQTTANVGGPAPIVIETFVEFNGVSESGAVIDSSKSLRIAPPPLAAPFTPGPVDVVVTTPGGSSTPPLQFVYIDDPLSVTDVAVSGPGGALVPRVVSTLGADSFDILGLGFLPGALVEIDGVAVSSSDVKIPQPDLIEVVRTPVRAAGVVTVTVVNPDAAFDVLSGRLRFADPPHIIRVVDPASRSVPAGVDTEITLEGFNIHPDAEVHAESSSLIVTFNDGAELRFTLPAGPAGRVELELVNPSDGLSARFDLNRE